MSCPPSPPVSSRGSQHRGWDARGATMAQNIYDRGAALMKRPTCEPCRILVPTPVRAYSQSFCPFCEPPHLLSGRSFLLKCRKFWSSKNSILEWYKTYNSAICNITALKKNLRQCLKAHISVLMWHILAVWPGVSHLTNCLELQTLICKQGHPRSLNPQGGCEVEWEATSKTAHRLTCGCNSLNVRSP